MTWTAPASERAEPPGLPDERTMLDSYLDYHRATLLAKCAGLTAEQLALRPIAPSNLSLLGLVRHMADVERAWFRNRFLGAGLDYRFSSEDDLDGDFDNIAAATASDDFAAYATEVELARAAVAGRSLDDSFLHPRLGAELNLRWVYGHMIEEYARHNGHADLLRETIDGVTGE